ncbi:MAG: TerC family protein [Gemmataceae bacterium]
MLALALGFAVAFMAMVRPAHAQPHTDGINPTDPATFPKVEVESAAGGTRIKGKLRLGAITLKTNYGSTTITMDHIRRITLQNEPIPEAMDTVQLVDKSLLRGHVTADQFVVDRDGGGEVTWKRSEIREIQVVHEVPVSMVAIILGLLTLTAMEIILGVDNIVFLAIVVGKLPPAQQPQARKLGLAAALGTRLLLLFSLTFLLGLTAPIFTLPNLGFLQDMEAREISWRDIILLVGGFFLIGKSTMEMHEKLEHARHARSGEPTPKPGKPASFAWTIVTIAAIDILFSLDSVVTAVGMVEELWVMVVAMVLAMLVMLYFAKGIGDFVNRHPTVKVLALSFLILIGVMLVAEGLGQHMDKGYIYAAMAFSVVVEMINMKLRKPAAMAK